MRRHIFSLTLLVAAAGLAFAGSATALEDVSPFPADMLEINAQQPLLASSSPAVVAVPDVPVDATATVASTDRMSERLRPVPARHVVVANAHVVKRIKHVRHARHPLVFRVPVAAIRQVPLPVRPDRLVQTASSVCSGFCGKYVFVGVGF